MAKPFVPCQNCEKRRIKCHEHCDAYKEYKEEIKRSREAEDKRYQEINDFYLSNPNKRKKKIVVRW